MHNTENVLSNLIRKNKNLKKAYLIYKINRVWDKIVSENIAEKTYVEKIYNSNVYVLTSSSVWTSQLSLMKKDILKKLASDNDFSRIKDLKFKTSSAKEIKKLKNELFNKKTSFGSKGIDKNKKQVSVEKNGVLVDNLEEALLEKVNLLYKKDKLNKQKRLDAGWKVCTICSRQFNGSKDICSICLSNIHKDKKGKIISMLKECPWATYEHITEKYKNISNKDFINIKQDYKDNIYDSIKNKTYLYKREQELKVKESIREDILTFAMLASSQPPYLLTEEIIKKKIGKFYFNEFYLGEGKDKE